jgi:aminotransferase in exopolysaccharide biosynthesis
VDITTVVDFIQDTFKTKKMIALHEPTFVGNELRYVKDTIDSTFVSSVGEYVDKFEFLISDYTKSVSAVATTNGTSALTTCLYLLNVKTHDLVITQPLSFVATCNSIFHLGAKPIFCDISETSLGLCPKAVEKFLKEYADVHKGVCIYRPTKQKIKAILPMHTFGHPVQLDELKLICDKWCISLIEDAAESLGSFYKGKHTGTTSALAALSFNGNKVITTGGGGMILCQNKLISKKAKHITTTARVSKGYEFYHDEAGFNYRMPNLNAALGVAQFEMLANIISKKRDLANTYEQFFNGSNFKFFKEPSYAKSNYWLNTLICEDYSARQDFLEYTNSKNVMTRPVWELMHRLPMYSSSLRGDLSVAEKLGSLIVNIPSSPINLS